MDEIKKTRLVFLVPILIVMAIVGAPLDGRAAVDPCSATLSPELRLTIPAVNIEGNFYSLGLQITVVPSGLIETEIIDVQSATQSCTMPAVLSIDTVMVLQIPSMIFGSDDYGVELEYDSTVAVAVVSARQGVESSNSKLLWKPKIYKNKGVWRGSTICKYSGSATASGITSTQVTTTYASATFACAQSPSSIGLFGGCLTSAGGFDDTATWKLVSGSIQYALAGTQAIGGGCVITLNGQKTFPMKIPDLGDGLIITSKESNPNVFYVSGSGRQNVPPYKARQITDCPEAGIHLDVGIDIANDFTDWLGFGTNLYFVGDFGDNTSIIAHDVEIAHISTPTVNSSLICSWSFTYIP